MLITNAISEIAFNLGYSDVIWATLSCLPLAPLPSTRMCHLLVKLKEISVLVITGRERLIRSHSSARFCFELSGNSN